MTVNLLDVGSGFKRTAINSNFTTIESELNNNVLTKDGGTQLEADLDFNSNKAINIADGVNNSDAVNLGQVNGIISAASSGLIASQQETQKGSAAVSRVFTFAGITYTVGGNNLHVFHNGVKLAKGRDYTETSSSSITMVSGYTINANDDFDFITNIATTSSVSDTSAISHTEDSTTYNLATYLQNRDVVKPFTTYELKKTSTSNPTVSGTNPAWELDNGTQNLVVSNGGSTSVASQRISITDGTNNILKAGDTSMDVRASEFTMDDNNTAITWYAGALNPPGAGIGANGDMYVSTGGNGTLYQKRSGAWVSI